MSYRCLRACKTFSSLLAIQSRAGSRHLTTLSDIGIKSFPNTPVQLLPLLQSKESKTGPYPSHRLDAGDMRGHDTRIRAEDRALGARIAFSIPNELGELTQWLSTSHTFPAAWPRSHPGSTSPPSQKLPKVDLKRAAFNKEQERQARAHDFEEWEKIAGLHSVESCYPPYAVHQARVLAEKLAKGDEVKGIEPQPQLWGVVQRLAPETPIEGGMTLILAHANGFHKELYEPTMQSMLNALTKSDVRIAEIWSLDSVDSGTAGVMNADRLGLAVAWSDQSRDILQFMDYYLPLQQLHTGQADRSRRNIPQYKIPPTILPRNQKGVARKQGRKVVGVGHSFNGSGMMLLSTIVPDIFDGVFIIDPVGVTPSDFSALPVPAETPLARGAIARKDVFSSLHTAEKYMRSRPFFTAWDPRVLDLHLRFGLYPCASPDDPNVEAVTLCQSKWREALAYSSYFLGTWAYDHLRRSKFEGWGHLVCMSETDNLFFGEKGSAPLMQQFTRHFSSRATAEVLKGGHLVVQEQPGMLGAHLAKTLRMPSHNRNT